jgi:hypothetical protein
MNALSDKAFRGHGPEVAHIPPRDAGPIGI